MSAGIDPSLVGLVEHIDGRFAEAERKRSEGMLLVHNRVESVALQIATTHARLEAHQIECDKRWARHDGDARHDDTNTSNWLRTGAMLIYTSAAALIGWIMGHLKGGQS